MGGACVRFAVILSHSDRYTDLDQQSYTLTVMLRTTNRLLLVRATGDGPIAGL